MHYEYKSISINKLAANKDGFVEPLCNSCKCKDCTNPVEWRKISIIGVTKNYRILVHDFDSNFVIQCKGFIP